MATEQTASQQNSLPVDYYAPDFKIEVEGLELDPEAHGDVIQVKVVMDIENMTSFELIINNWDDRKLDFKYTDARLPGRGGSPGKRVFEVGNRVRIRMGYADRLKYMVHGQIMTLSPDFPETGAPTITVSGLDAMVRLRDKHPADGETKRYENKTDSQIAEEIASRNQLKCRVTPTSQAHESVVQKNQDDAMFLKERAKRIDFECFFYVDPESGEEILHFVSPTDARDGRKPRVFTFNWGESLCSFKPQLSISHQVGKVTVLGWDPRTKERIRETATPADLPRAGGSGKNGANAAAEVLNNKEEIIVDAPIQSKQEARAYAIARLAERAYEYITGTGKVIGLPEMRQGDNVKLDKLGERFNGLYYVKRVEHVFDRNGYLTELSVRRIHDGEKT